MQSNLQLWGMKTKTMTNDELVKYVLERVPAHIFNAATKSFSTQMLYQYVKREMIAKFEMFEGSKLMFAVKMADAFRPYHIYEVAGKYPTDIRSDIDKLRHTIFTFPTMHPTRHKLTEEYNAMVDTFNEAIKPQGKLIKLYKNIQKNVKKEAHRV